MQKAKSYLMITIVLFMGWMIFFQGTQSASSSPLMGFTLTPTNTQVVITPTNTQVVITPTNTQVVVTPSDPNTLPPPPQQTPFIIPVTGTDRRVNIEGAINLGLVLVAFGLIIAGLKARNK